MIRVVIYLWLLFHYVFNLDSDSLQIKYPQTTCEETSECIMNNIGNDPSGYIYKCIQKAESCDTSCLSEIKTYQSCTSNCLCLSPSQKFSWECIDNCKNSTSRNFITIVDCIYEPCRKNSTTQFSEISSYDTNNESSNIETSHIHPNSTHQNSTNEEKSNFGYFFWFGFIILILFLAFFIIRKWRKSYLVNRIGYTNRLPENYSEFN
jgi:hypothetical protein